jgi:hypothetical protein
LPDETFAFDVFLSHNSKDKPAVRQIKQALEERGFRVWLDETELIPGRRWIAALEDALKKTATIAACISENGLGPWERPEIEAALMESVNRGLPVIPVLLPNPSPEVEISLFLKAFTWVDLRTGLTDAGIDRLAWGIRGEKTSRSSSPAKPNPPRLHNLPFSSLGPLFQGRDEDTLGRPRGRRDVSAGATPHRQRGRIGAGWFSLLKAWAGVAASPSRRRPAVPVACPGCRNGLGRLYGYAVSGSKIVCWLDSCHFKVDGGPSLERRRWLYRAAPLHRLPALGGAWY